MRFSHHRSTLFMGVFAMLLGAVIVSAQESPRIPTETTFRTIEAALSELESSPNAAAATAPIARAKRLLTEGRLQTAAGKLRAAGFTADRLDAVLGLITLQEQNAATSSAIIDSKKEIAASKAQLNELKAQLESLSKETSPSSESTKQSVSEEVPSSGSGALP